MEVRLWKILSRVRVILCYGHLERAQQNCVLEQRSRHVWGRVESSEAGEGAKRTEEREQVTDGRLATYKLSGKNNDSKLEEKQMKHSGLVREFKG